MRLTRDGHWASWYGAVLAAISGLMCPAAAGAAEETGSKTEPAPFAIRLIDPAAKSSAPAKSDPGPSSSAPTATERGGSTSSSSAAFRQSEGARDLPVREPTPAVQGRGAAGTASQEIESVPVEKAPRTASSPAKPASEALKPIPATPSNEPVEVEAAAFNGVSPGVTTVGEMQKAWGQPKEIRKARDAVYYLFAVAPFDQVEVTCTNEVVASIVIRFEKAFPANVVIEQLELSKIRPVMVSNEKGDILGEAFPERGVLLSFEPSPEPGKPSMKVGQIVLEAISAEPFVLRAETNLDVIPSVSLRDLEQALKLQPRMGRAHWLRSRILADMQDLEKAMGASAEAVRLDPNNAQYLVTRAQILGQAGHFKEAIQTAEKGLDAAERRPHIRARALCLLGDLYASAAPPDYKQAVQHHSQAIKVADELANDSHPAIRVAAKEVLIDAHLGAAHDIAWGTWKEKDKAISKWLERAALFAEDLIKNEGGSNLYRLRVSTRALAACVGARGLLDPTSWTEDTLRIGQTLVKSIDDPVRKAQLQWELGMALYDALQTFQIRGEHDSATKYGALAIEYLEQGQRTPNASTSYLLGRVYFRMGAVYALRDQNHRMAIQWFEKAVPLLEKPLPPEAVADLGRHGETFVSMGVSYWETGDRERSLELTQRGVALMEQAVKQGLLEETSLTVAYSNLATMHRYLGHTENAQRFESLAARTKKSAMR